LDKRSRKVKFVIDELSQDERLSFRVTIIDILSSQLENRFAGMKDVFDNYRVLQSQLGTIVK